MAVNLHRGSAACTTASNFLSSTASPLRPPAACGEGDAFAARGESSATAAAGPYEAASRSTCCRRRAPMRVTSSSDGLATAASASSGARRGFRGRAECGRTRVPAYGDGAAGVAEAGGSFGVGSGSSAGSSAGGRRRRAAERARGDVGGDVARAIALRNQRFSSASAALRVASVRMSSDASAADSGRLAADSGRLPAGRSGVSPRGSGGGGEDGGGGGGVGDAAYLTAREV